MFSHTLTTALEQLCPLSHNSCLNFLERVTLMHELYRMLSAISADTFSQHFRTYFIIPCNPMIYKHLKLLLRPQWSGDISNRSSPAGLEHTKKRDTHRMSLFCIIESTRRDSNPFPIKKILKRKEFQALFLGCSQTVVKAKERA